MATREPFSYEESPERIAACMSCCLPDCYPESKKCALHGLQSRKTRSAKTKTKDPNKRNNEKLQLRIAINQTGLTVHQWCKDHGINYDQLLRFEKTPPKHPTPMSVKIQHELRKSGVLWTGQHCNIR